MTSSKGSTMLGDKAKKEIREDGLSYSRRKNFKKTYGKKAFPCRSLDAYLQFLKSFRQDEMPAETSRSHRDAPDFRL